MRGAPHVGFSRLIRRINARSSRSILGLPPRRQDFQRQYARKPRRCQRSTVSGFTMTMVSNSDGNSRYNQTRIRRSMFRSRTRGRRRLNTSSCCRSARISASREARASTTGEQDSGQPRQHRALQLAHSRAFVTRDEILTSDSGPGQDLKALFAKHESAYPHPCSEPRCWGMYLRIAIDGPLTATVPVQLRSSRAIGDPGRTEAAPIGKGHLPSSFAPSEMGRCRIGVLSAARAHAPR
jgi:hypothetical protein